MSNTDDNVYSWNFIIIYGLIQLLFFFIIEPIFNNSLKKRKEKDYLCLVDKVNLDWSNFSTSLITSASVITQIIEYGILSRYSFFGYKNAVRSNLRIFPSIILTLLIYNLITMISQYFGFNFSLSELAKAVNNPNPAPTSASAFVTSILGISGFLISAFILERSHLHKKWEYLAGVYNKRIETDPGIKRDIIEAALVLDMIEMEMWSHRSYRGIFKNILVKAYSMGFDEYPFKIKYLKYTEASLFEKKISKQDAYKIVEKYQARLINYEKIDSLKKSAS